MIDIRRLTKVYGNHRAASDLTLQRPAGRGDRFLGPNGAGMTTTFRCLLGLGEPTSGEAPIHGGRYRDLPAPRRQVGALRESAGFHPARSGRDHLRVIARAAGIDAGRVDGFADAVALRVDPAESLLERLRRDGINAHLSHQAGRRTVA